MVTVCAETVDAPNVSFQVYYELSYMSGKFELKKLFCDGCSKVANVDYGSNKFAFSDYSNKIEFFDVRNRLVEELQYNKNGILYDLKISKSGRYIALAESQNIYIYGIENKECICNYEVENGCFVDFLDDEKLLIGTWKKGYCLLI